MHLQESLPLLGVFQQCLDEVSNCVRQFSYACSVYISPLHVCIYVCVCFIIDGCRRM